jgi:glycosyltransferase involved in cell wall biosynthesis
MASGSGRTGLERIAVLTPTLPSRRSLLDEATASVAAQTYPVSHLVGVDQDREGPSVIRNRLAASSDADWYLPLDDDDLLDADCVERLVEQSSDADVVVPWCRVVDVPGLEPWTPNRLFRPESMLLYNFVPVTCLVRAELWRDVGGMPERVEVEDWRFWLRCLAEGARFRVVPEVCWSYRRGLAGSRNQWAAAAA